MSPKGCMRVFLLIMFSLLIITGLKIVERMAAVPSVEIIRITETVFTFIIVFSWWPMAVLGAIIKRQPNLTFSSLASATVNYLIYIFLYITFTYLYFWNRFPDESIFEARFTSSITTLGILIYIHNKMEVKGEIREMIFRVIFGK